MFFFHGAGGTIRTIDPRIMSRVFYHCATKPQPIIFLLELAFGLDLYIKDFLLLASGGADNFIGLSPMGGSFHQLVISSTNPFINWSIIYWSFHQLVISSTGDFINW
jgi:hypothetical protein